MKEAREPSTGGRASAEDLTGSTKHGYLGADPGHLPEGSVSATVPLTDAAGQALDPQAEVRRVTEISACGATPSPSKLTSETVAQLQLALSHAILHYSSSRRG